MKANKTYSSCDKQFWAEIRYCTEKLGASTRITKKEKAAGKESVVKAFTINEIHNLGLENNISFSDEALLSNYSKYRADLINITIRKDLMTLTQAQALYTQKYLPLFFNGSFHSKQLINKQGGIKKQINYFASTINIITEQTIRNVTKKKHAFFDSDPHGHIILIDNDAILGVTSRRFDGVYPSLQNPSITWEVKEYYHTTSFGSRVADGIYETILDGYEFRDYEKNNSIYHVFMFDGYETWWNLGRSYLCRIIDALNMGFVDEIIAGIEIETEWPNTLKQFV